MRKRMKRIGFAIGVLGIVAFLSYQQFWRPIPVELAQATSDDLEIELTGTGLLDAHVSAVISTKIAGRVSSIMFDQNDTIQAGDVICRLDDSDLLGQVEIGEASVAVANAAISRAQTDIARSNAVLDLTQRDAQRTREAFEQGAASVSELDTIIQQVKVSEAEVARSEAMLVEAQRELISAERTLDYYRAQLDETVITSPFSGIVVRRDRDPGDVLVPGSSIARLIDPNELWLSAWVDESAINSIEPQQEARIVFRSEPNREYPGQVVRVGLEVDPESREFLVDIALTDLPPRWAIGQRAEAYIKTHVLSDTVVVPGAFIFTREGHAGVFVLSDGRAQWRACELGERGREQVQIRSGIQAGETIIRGDDEDSSRALRSGKRVTER